MRIDHVEMVGSGDSRRLDYLLLKLEGANDVAAITSLIGGTSNDFDDMYELTDMYKIYSGLHDIAVSEGVDVKFVDVEIN